MKKIENISIGIERAFYGIKNTIFSNVVIDGLEDGESAFKECSNIEINSSEFKLRYPLWHVKNGKIYGSHMYDTCRAAMWYDESLLINKCSLYGIKAIRECKNISIEQCDIKSEEFGWKSSHIQIKDSRIDSVYAFFNTDFINIENVDFKGKYSFQYCKNIIIKNSNLDTKDAFWHSENVIVENSIIKGEYLAWYAKNIKFINCKIKGTQPICYSNGIEFVNCEFDESTDLAFEYSEVNGNIFGSIKSIKNMNKGTLMVKGNPEIIKDEYDRSGDEAKIIIKRD